MEQRSLDVRLRCIPFRTADLLFAVRFRFAGAVSGGITGGKNALESGKNVWWGSEVKYGRTQWSINPSEKPSVTIDFDVKTVSNNINDCVPASFTEINDYYGGDMTYQDMYH